MKTIVAVFFISLLISYFTAKLFLFLDIKQFYDIPDRMRKIHEKPILRAGGIAIFVGILFSILSLFFYTNKLTTGFALNFDKFEKILLPASLMFLLGIFDDAFGLSAKVKLPVQIIAAVVVFLEGIKLSVVKIPLIGVVDFGYFAPFITILWIVGITNAFNFIDGMDGLASGISFFAAFTIFLISLLEREYVISLFTASICGSILGFIKFNWHPAKLFLGDSGSYFLGFLIGSLSIISSTKSSIIVAITIPVMIMAYPLLDLLLAVLRRILRGRSIFSADREHIHHKLLERGYSYKGIVLLLYLISGLFGFLAILVMFVKSNYLSFIIPLFSGIFAVYFVRKLGYEEFKSFISKVDEVVDIENEKKFKFYLERIKRSSTEEEFIDVLKEFFKEFEFEDYFFYIEGSNGDKFFIGDLSLLDSADRTGNLFLKFPFKGENLRKVYIMLSSKRDFEFCEKVIEKILPEISYKVSLFGDKLLKVKDKN